MTDSVLMMANGNKTMSLEDLSCLFCKPKKLFSTWVDLKIHLEQHIIDASAKRPCIGRSCNNCSSTGSGCTNPFITSVPVPHHESFKKTEDARKIVGLVRPVIQRLSCPPSTCCTNAALDAMTYNSNPQQQADLSSIVINVKRKLMPTGSSETISSAPLLLVAAPHVDVTTSQIHAPQHILSIVPLEKRALTNFVPEPLASGIKKSSIEGVDNIGTFQDAAVLQAAPFTKLSIVHSKGVVQSFPLIKAPASVVGQDFSTSTVISSKEECRDVSGTVDGHYLVPFSITNQTPGTNTPSYNHGNAAASGSSNLSCMSSPCQGSTVLIENASNEEHNFNSRMVVLASEQITSANFSTTTHSPNTKVFHVLGNTPTISSASSFSNICLSSSSSLTAGTSLETNCSGTAVSCKETTSSLYGIPSLMFDDAPKHLDVSSHVSLEVNSASSAPEILPSGSCSAFIPSNICSVSVPESSSSISCSLKKMGALGTSNNSHNSSGNVSIISNASESGQTSVTSVCEEEVDDPLHDNTEDGAFAGKIDVQTKVNSKLNQKCFDCKKCDATFSSRRAALVHQAQTHGRPRAFKCLDCNRSFSSSHNLTTHRTHRHASTTGKREPVLCTVCGKSFASKSNLMLHARLHSGERPFVCPVCNKSFSRKCTLEKHSLYHTGERRYTCDRCGAGFYTSHSLSRHIKLHDGERSFACDVCDAKYVVMSDLKRHKLSHAAVKPFSCDLCSKTFSRKHDLNVHALYHARSSRFSCDFCDRRFVEESNYKRHVRQHTGEKPYQCNTCGVRYSQLHHVKKHLQTCHRDALKTTTSVGSIASPLYSGAYSVPHAKSRNRKGYLEKISDATR